MPLLSSTPCTASKLPPGPGCGDARVDGSNRTVYQGLWLKARFASADNGSRKIIAVAPHTGTVHVAVKEVSCFQLRMVQFGAWP